MSHKLETMTQMSYNGFQILTREESGKIFMKKKRIAFLLAFLLPLLIWLLIYSAEGQYPFGDNTLLIWDMNWQYASFFSHLHDILHGEASWSYTFSRALGGDMTGIWGYYLMSPFNLLFYFFDAEHIYMGILLVMLLKMGACGLAMYWFLSRGKEEPVALIFSTAYALSGYIVAYQFNIFWMDALILLPLVVWGIERLVEEKKSGLYVWSLALAITANFYTGYMLCLFSVLYFLCYFLLVSRKKKEFMTLVSYAGNSILAGALSAGITIPMLYSMSGGKSAFHLETLTNFTKLFGYTGLIKAGFAGTISQEQITGGMPLIYCGIFTLAMAGYWLVRGMAAYREKAAYMLLLLFLVVSFAHYNLNCMWHGFSTPMGSPYRFSFLYSFLLLYMAYKGYVQMQENALTEEKGKWIFGILALGLLGVLVLERGAFLQTERKGLWLFNVLLLCLYTAVVIVFWKKRIQVWLCMALMCMELFGSAEYLYTYSNQYQSVSVTEYREYMQKVSTLVEQVKEEEGLFRTVMTGEAYRVPNDALSFNLYGLDSYTSVEKSGTMLAALNFGYQHSINFGMSYGGGGTKASEALLGVKYIISSEYPGGDYKVKAETAYMGLYENPNAFPLAFLTTDAVFAADSEAHQTFRYLNELYQSVAGSENAPVFQELEKQWGSAEQCVRDEEGIYHAYEGADNAYVECEIKGSAAGNVYVQYWGAGASQAELYVNESVISLEEQGNAVKRLGMMEPGDTMRLRFYIADGQQFDPEGVYIYEEDAKILTAYAGEAQEQDIKIEADTDSRIMVECENETATTAYLLCTIPYDEGWHIKVDGVAVEAVETGNLMAIPVEPGEHRVELRYIPQGLYLGLGIMALALLIRLIPFLCLHFPHQSYYNVHGSNER